MTDVTRLLEAANRGDRQAAAELLPLVYEELRELAAARMAEERPGQTLQATALVHEAYLRLVGDQQFSGRGHFFAAAAEAMRRILVDSARRKAAQKRGGGLVLRGRGWNGGGAVQEAAEVALRREQVLDVLAQGRVVGARAVQVRGPFRRVGDVQGGGEDGALVHGIALARHDEELPPGGSAQLRSDLRQKNARV